MNRKGLIGIIILGIIGFLIIVGIVAGIYFYNFYVFKEIRVCVGEGTDTKYPCSVQKDCLDMLNFSDNAVDGAPDFVRENFDNILNSAIYCKSTCFVGVIRGINQETGDIEGLDNCLDKEDEFVMKVRGKEGLEILNWMKDKK